MGKNSKNSKSKKSSKSSKKKEASSQKQEEPEEKYIRTSFQMPTDANSYDVSDLKEDKNGYCRFTVKIKATDEDKALYENPTAVMFTYEGKLNYRPGVFMDDEYKGQNMSISEWRKATAKTNPLYYQMQVNPDFDKPDDEGATVVNVYRTIQLEVGRMMLKDKNFKQIKKTASSKKSELSSIQKKKDRVLKDLKIDEKKLLNRKLKRSKDPEIIEAFEGLVEELVEKKVLWPIYREIEVEDAEKNTIMETIVDEDGIEHEVPEVNHCIKSTLRPRWIRTTNKKTGKTSSSKDPSHFSTEIFDCTTKDVQLLNGTFETGSDSEPIEVYTLHEDNIGRYLSMGTVAIQQVSYGSGYIHKMGLTCGNDVDRILITAYGSDPRKKRRGRIGDSRLKNVNMDKISIADSKELEESDSDSEDEGLNSDNESDNNSGDDSDDKDEDEDEDAEGDSDDESVASDANTDPDVDSDDEADDESVASEGSDNTGAASDSDVEEDEADSDNDDVELNDVESEDEPESESESEPEPKKKSSKSSKKKKKDAKESSESKKKSSKKSSKKKSKN